MQRRAFVAAVGGLLACPGALRAQERKGAMPLLAVLVHGKEGALGVRITVLREALRELGYTEGRNLRMAVRWSENQLERLPGLARELLAMKPDLVIGSPMLAAQAFHRESKTIPIVMASGAGAQKAGLIASLARPGGNVTGAINQLEELTAKQLELLKALVPRAKRVIVLSSGKSMVEDETREGARAAAKVLGLTLVDAWADTPEKFAGVPARCGRERCDALLVLLDPQLVNLRSELVTFAAKLRIPAVYPNLEYADDGGLLAYSIDANEIFRRVAAYVDKILKGAKPGDLPVELPTKFELVINLKAARAQGIAIPQPLLLRANRVIE